MTTERKPIQPDYAIHPGEILKETLEARGITKSELSARTGITPKTISQIVNCKAPVTPETAIAMEKVLGVSAELWNNLDSRYRLFSGATSRVGTK
jgi:addiction module HigA family antidote